MKKGLYLLLVLLVSVSVLVGCKKADEVNISEEQVEEVVEEKENEQKVETEETDVKESIVISEEEAEEACTKITEDLEMYTFILVYLDNDDMYHSDTDEVVVNLDEHEITRASAICTANYVDKEYYLNAESDGSYSLSDDENYGDLLVEEISKKQLNKTSNNLFGVDADVKNLEVFSPDSSLYDAVRMKEDDEVVSRLFYQFENEGVLEYLGQKVSIDDETVICEKDAYCGYWGYARFLKSNYKITYELEKNEASDYGFIIKSLKYQRTDNEENWVEEEDFSDKVEANESLSLGERSDNHPFWGVFVYASKDLDEAVKYADEVKAKGFDADYLDTPSWSGLNKDLWIVVTAGKYDTKEEAEEALEDVKAAGYDNAYVRYTGEYSLY